MLSAKTIKPFVLLSKEKRIPISSVNRELPEMLSTLKAETVDVVEIGKVNNPEQKIRITTFRNDKDEVVEMVHEYDNIEKPETHRLYRELPDYGDKSLKGRLVQLFENLDISGRFKAWQKVATEKQYVKSSEAGEKTHVTIAKVSTDERTIQPVVKEEHKLTEYYVPKAHNGQKIEPKYIEFETETDASEIPIIRNLSASKGVEIPENDEYLAMRIYDSDNIRVPVTRTALKEVGLESLKIPVEDSFSMKPATSGAFNENCGNITFNVKYQNKPDIIETAFHETEHAYQYSILSITDKLKTQFGDKCRKMFKGEITPKIENEAALYEQGHLNYVSPDVNYQKYRDNILEQYAWDAGKSGLRYYLQKGKELSEQFPRIPSKEL